MPAGLRGPLRRNLVVPFDSPGRQTGSPGQLPHRPFERPTREAPSASLLHSFPAGRARRRTDRQLFRAHRGLEVKRLVGRLIAEIPRVELCREARSPRGALVVDHQPARQGACADFDPELEVGLAPGEGEVTAVPLAEPGVVDRKTRLDPVAYLGV